MAAAMQVYPDPTGLTEVFTLAEVVSATGFSAEVLRAWERRYGFPVPIRDGQGRRIFPAAQMDRLRVLRRLLDNGAKPSQVVSLSPQALIEFQQNAPARYADRGIGQNADVSEAMRLIGENDVARLSAHLNRCLGRRGAGNFVHEVAAPLTVAAGEAWHSRRISIYQEHAYTEAMKRVLSTAAGAITGDEGPTVLLTTLPEENHGLGLAMVEVLLALEGCRCIHLGLQAPAMEVVAAAAAYRAEVVALSFSSFFLPRRAVEAVWRMRAELPDTVALWVGGACSGLAQPLPAGVTRFEALQTIGPKIAQLRAAA